MSGQHTVFWAPAHVVAYETWPDHGDSRSGYLMRIATFACAAALLLACGGRVDDPAPTDVGVAAPPRAPAPAAPSQSSPTRGVETVAGDVGAPTAIALSGEAAYFVTRTTTLGGELVRAGAVFVAYKAGGDPLMLAIDKQGATYEALALTSEHVFYGASDGRVLRVPARGGDVTEVASVGSPIVALSALGKDVYYAAESGEVGRLADEGGALPLATLDGPARALAATDDAVLVAGGGAPSEILRVARDGAEPAPLAPAGGSACGLIRAGDRAFWTAGPADPGTRGAARSVALAGGAVATVAEGDFTACALAADGKDLYFVTAAPQAALPVRASGATPGVSLMRAPIAGGPASPIESVAAPLPHHGALAADASHVYWLDATGVRRVRK